VKRAHRAAYESVDVGVDAQGRRWAGAAALLAQKRAARPSAADSPLRLSVPEVEAFLDAAFPTHRSTALLTTHLPHGALASRSNRYGRSGSRSPARLQMHQEQGAAQRPKATAAGGGFRRRALGRANFRRPLA
jgi:hypothetical protein